MDWRMTRGIVALAMALTAMAVDASKATVQAPATPTGVQVVSAPDLRAQVAVLCGELFRNRNAGILFMVPPGVRIDDRICFQGSDLETMSCKTVGQIKADWKIK